MLTRLSKIQFRPRKSHSAGTKDPVCGMEIEKASSQKLEHDGRVYYFCSIDCKNRFLAEPAKYIQVVNEPAGMEGHSHHNHHHGCC